MSEGPSRLEVVGNVTVFVPRLQRHVRVGAMLSLNLNVDVRQLLNREGLAFRLVQLALALVHDFFHAALQVLSRLDLFLVVDLLEEGVVFVVGGELDWVLVVGKQRIVAIRQISQ